MSENKKPRLAEALGVEMGEKFIRRSALSRGIWRRRKDTTNC